MRSELEIAVSALKKVADPAHSSMRYRDPNCVRYLASDALDRLKRRGVDTNHVRWVRYDTAGGNIAGEPERIR